MPQPRRKATGRAGAKPTARKRPAAKAEDVVDWAALAADASTEDLRAMADDETQPSEARAAAQAQLAHREPAYFADDGEDLDADLPPTPCPPGQHKWDSATPLAGTGDDGMQLVAEATCAKCGAVGTIKAEDPGHDETGAPYTPPYTPPSFTPDRRGVSVLTGEEALRIKPGPALSAAGGDALERAGLELRNADFVVVAVPTGQGAALADALRSIAG